MSKHRVWCSMLAKKCSLSSIGTTGIVGFPLWLSGREPAGQCRRCRFDPWVRKMPQRSKWQPTPVLLPGKSHGQRSLAGYSLWGCKELDVTERVNTTNNTHSNFFPSMRRWWKWSELLKIPSVYLVVASFATKDFHFEFFCLCSFLGNGRLFTIWATRGSMDMNLTKYISHKRNSFKGSSNTYFISLKQQVWSSDF